MANVDCSKLCIAPHFFILNTVKVLNIMAQIVMVKTLMVVTATTITLLVVYKFIYTSALNLTFPHMLLFVRQH
jgi:hypothetical protein